MQAVVDSNALEALVTCLEEFDPSVKEAAAWALGYIARHNAGTSRFTTHIANRSRDHALVFTDRR